MDVLQLGAAALAVMMAQELPPVTYHCNDAGKSTIIAHFKQTDPPTVTLEHGQGHRHGRRRTDRLGARYVTSKGILFWEKGGEAQVGSAEGQALHLQLQTVRLDTAERRRNARRALRLAGDRFGFLQVWGPFAACGNRVMRSRVAAPPSAFSEGHRCSNSSRPIRSFGFLCSRRLTVPPKWPPSSAMKWPGTTDPSSFV